ncbi:MAG TPA: universal stress protein [Polyangiaceae bacterium]|nr:universal stress protein [Polyangiaceae bacterium]
MKTLLVALDGSARAQHVLEAGVAQAKVTGAKLVLFRAVGIPVELPHSAMALSPTDVLNGLEERARAELSELGRTAATGVPWEIRIETGSAWQAICQAARAVDAALIIIGSHGYGALDRVLGTTAGRVVNHADRSVLVVRSVESAVSAAPGAKI